MGGIRHTTHCCSAPYKCPAPMPSTLNKKSNDTQTHTRACTHMHMCTHTQTLACSLALTVHPPDLHLTVVGSTHDQRHAGMECCPVHTSIMTLRAKVKICFEVINGWGFNAHLSVQFIYTIGVWSNVKNKKRT